MECDFDKQKRKFKKEQREQKANHDEIVSVYKGYMTQYKKENRRLDQENTHGKEDV